MLSVIHRDDQTFKMIQSTIKQDPQKYHQLKFLLEFKIRTFIPCLNLAIGRRVTSHALQAACHNVDLRAITDLVAFVKLHKILAHISPVDVKFLILNQEYAIIMTLVHNQIQVRLPISNLKKATTLRKVMSTVWETESVQTNKMPEHIEKYIKSSDFIKALIEARKDKTLSMQQLKVIQLKFLLELQHYLDYDEIFNLMFRYRILDTLFDFAESLELKESSRE